MRIEIPPLKLSPAITRGYVSDILANQQLRQQEYDSWQLSITSKYEVAEGCRPANIFDALIGRIDDPSLVLMNKGKKVKLVRVESVKQLLAERWHIIACEFNKRNKDNIAKAREGIPERVNPRGLMTAEEYENMKAEYHNSTRYNPARFIWSR